jgi:hypothetical protein
MSYKLSSENYRAKDKTLSLRRKGEKEPEREREREVSKKMSWCSSTHR